MLFCFFHLSFLPFMKDFPLGSDHPNQPNLDFMIHPVASGSALSLSSPVLWVSWPQPLVICVHYSSHLHLGIHTSFSIAKYF